MAEFTKTIIVDTTHAEETGKYYQTIQGAVNYLANLATPGGVVIVEAGDYYVTGTGNTYSIEVPSNTTVLGRGNVTVNVTGNLQAFINKHYYSGTDNRIVISGFLININYSSGDENQSVIDMKRVSNSVIEKITFKVTSSGGVSSGRAAVKFEGDSSNFCEGNVITQCNVGDFGNSSNFGLGIYLKSYCKRNVITDNHFLKCHGHIFIEDNSEENVISNNTLYTIQSSGSDYICIYILNSNKNCVEGNNVDGAGQGDHGISIERSIGCSVLNNICKNINGNGILLISSSSTIRTDYNSIVGNVCHDCSGSGHNGIFLNGYCRYNAINGNNCYNNGGWGIRESDSSSGALKNDIVGNVCNSNSAGNIYSGSGTSSIKADNIES